jgi:Holliday junction DNA helicase RuvA
MIAYLRGRLLEKHPNQVVIEIGGVGYDISIPVSTFSLLPELGQEVALHVHTHVREDTLALFGFHSREEKMLFEKLITVSGIGPRLAISVLSGLPVPDLVSAIRRGALEHLVRIPGVGRKTAERIVVELRDKLDGLAGVEAARPVPASAFAPVEEEVLSALINLGCARPVAEKAVLKAKALGTAAEFEPLFRRAMEFIR